MIRFCEYCIIIHNIDNNDKSSTNDTNDKAVAIILQPREQPVSTPI